MNITLGEIKITLQKAEFSPGVSTFYVVLPSGKEFSCYLDERDNTFKPFYPPDALFSSDGELWEVGEFLIKSFSNLKRKDFRYGTIGIDKQYSYEPTINILGQDFLLYLQSEYRDDLIKNLIK